MKPAISAVATVFLALFAIVWGYFAIRLWFFVPTKDVATLTFDPTQINIAGILATGVATGTAAVLGIKVAREDGDKPRREQVLNAVKGSPLTLIGVAVYVLVGVVVLLEYFFRPGIAPDAVGAFSLGVIGWAGGAFAATFKGSDS